MFFDFRQIRGLKVLWWLSESKKRDVITFVLQIWRAGHICYILVDNSWSHSWNLQCQDSKKNFFFKFRLCYVLVGGIPGDSDGKRVCLQCRRPRFDPWVKKIPWRRERQPLQYSCLENAMDRAAWRAIVHGVTESDTAKQLTLVLVS